jgi:hypothetical protein
VFEVLFFYSADFYFFLKTVDHCLLRFYNLWLCVCLLEFLGVKAVDCGLELVLTARKLGLAGYFFLKRSIQLNLSGG